MFKIFISSACAALLLAATSVTAHYGVDHTGADHYHVASAHASAPAPMTAEERVKAGLCESPGVVSLAGEVILRIHAPAGGMDCQQRADAVQRRIIDSLSIGVVYPNDIYVKQVRGEWAVMVKDILMITADASSAKINGTTPRQLANIWCKNLQRTIPESTPQKPTR